MHTFQIIFYIFAGLGILAALGAISQNNPVRSVLFLVLTFFASAVIWIMLTAEFLSLILILVYVGAVMTLFLFVVMMLNIDTESRKNHFKRFAPFGFILAAVLVSFLLSSLPEGWSIATNLHEPTKQVSNTEELGMVLYTDYFLAFEMAAALLLVAIISAITLVHRQLTRSKRQSIFDQIIVDPKDRLTMVKMKSEHDCSKE